MTALVAGDSALVASNQAIRSSHMQVSINHADRQRQFEATARAAFELRAGRKLTNAEWVAARRRLLEFVRILRAWDHTTTSTKW